MNTKTILSSLFIILIVSGFAGIPHVKNRQVNQQQRIKQGIHNGELTKNEVYRVECQQARIQCAKQHAKSDGVITPYEKMKLDHMQDNASQDIFNQKHDLQDRP